MKRFFLKASLFLLPLLLCFGTVEVKLGALQNTYSQKRLDLEEQLNSIQILVLGPSNSLHGINPAYFSHTGFNLANASQTIFYDKELTLRYLDRLPALRLVIIPITYNSFYTQLADSKESFRQYFYSKYWGVDAPGMQALDFRRYSNIALYTPEKAFEFASKGFQVDLTEGLDHNGFLRYDTTDCLANISDEQGAKRVELYRRMMKEEHYVENVDMLTELVTTLRQRNIQVCLVTTPVYETFARYCEQSVWQKNAEAIQNLCVMHGCGYKNYFNDPRFTIRDFYDNDHLNFIGAARFSKMLNAEVVGLVNFR